MWFLGLFPGLLLRPLYSYCDSVGVLHYFLLSSPRFQPLGWPCMALGVVFWLAAQLFVII